MRRRYAELKDKNENLLKQLENGQQEIDRLNLKRAELEDASTRFYPLLKL